MLTTWRDGGADLRPVTCQGAYAERAVFGLAVVATAALQVLEPESKGSRALEALGMLAAERGAEL